MLFLPPRASPPTHLPISSGFSPHVRKLPSRSWASQHFLLSKQQAYRMTMFILQLIRHAMILRLNANLGLHLMCIIAGTAPDETEAKEHGCTAFRQLIPRQYELIHIPKASRGSTQDSAIRAREGRTKVPYFLNMGPKERRILTFHQHC